MRWNHSCNAPSADSLARVMLRWLILSTMAYALAGLSIAALPEFQRAPKESWPVHRGTAAQTGLSATTLPKSPALLWKYELGSGAGLAAAIADGTVYVGSEDGKLVALDLATGQQQWEFKREDAIAAPPTVFGDHIYVGDESGMLWCVRRRDGRDDWSFQTQGAIYSGVVPLPGLPPLPPRLLVGSYDGGLYCINGQDGDLLWKYGAGDKLHGTPAIIGKFAFVAGCDGYLHCVRHRDGALAAKFGFGAPSASSAAAAGGRLFMGTYGNQVFAIDFDVDLATRVQALPASQPATGTGEPELSSGRPPGAAEGNGPPPGAAVVDAGPPPEASPAASSAPASAPVGRGVLKLAWMFENPERQQPFMTSVATNGEVVVIGGRDKRVWCLNAGDGKVRWSFPTRKRVETSGLIVDGRVYFGSDDGTIYALGLSDGAAAWQYESGAPITCGPVAAHGRMIVGTADGSVFCFGRSP